MSKRGENIYKRKDGRWEGRYIKCRTLHGRIQYGYVYGKSYSAVKSKLKETASMPIQTSDSRGTQPTSYSEILKMWLLSAKNHVKESTFSRYVKTSGIEHANYHALRHTFATRCVELGFEIKSLSEILGHSNVNITLNKYVHSSFELKKKNMERLNLAIIE